MWNAKALHGSFMLGWGGGLASSQFTQFKVTEDCKCLCLIYIVNVTHSNSGAGSCIWDNNGNNISVILFC